MNFFALICFVICGLSAAGAVAVALRWAWVYRGRVLLNHAYQEQWLDGRVALSDLDDEVLLDVVDHYGFRGAPDDVYWVSCVRELRQRKLLAELRSRAVDRARGKVIEFSTTKDTKKHEAEG